MRLATTLSIMASLAPGAAQDQQHRNLDRERVGELIRELEDGKAGNPIGDSLTKMGEPVVPLLVECLRTEQTRPLSIRARAALAVLWRLGPQASGAAPFLLDHLATVDGDDVYRVVDVLAEIAPFAPRSFRATVRSHPLFDEGPPQLRDADETAKLVWLMGRHRLFARLAVDTNAPTADLVRELARNRIFAREVVAEELRRRGPEAEAAVRLLLAGVENPDAEPSGDRLEYDGTVVPQDDLFLYRAMEALLRIAPSDPRILPVYAYRIRKHPSPEARTEAAAAMGRMGADASAAVPTLLEALGDADGSVIREAITALGMIGPAAKEAIPALDELADHEDERFRERAKAALRRIRGSDR